MDRSITTRSFAMLLVVVATALHASAELPSKLPNLVVYISDDLGRLEMSVYGNDEAKTPTMDLLAASGMTFNNAYVASPSCCPTRAELITFEIERLCRGGWRQSFLGLLEQSSVCKPCEGESVDMTELDKQRRRPTSRSACVSQKPKPGTRLSPTSASCESTQCMDLSRRIYRLRKKPEQ